MAGGPGPRLEPLAELPPEISERPSQLSESGWSGPSVHVTTTQSISFYDPFHPAEEETEGPGGPVTCLISHYHRLPNSTGHLHKHT